MVLARSIPNPQKPQHTLLKAGYALNPDDIQRLRSLRVFYLWVRYPSLDFLDDILDPELTRQQQELYVNLKKTFTEAQELSLARIEYSHYVQAVSKLFQRLLATQSKSSTWINELFGDANDIFLHGVTVSHLALLLGLRLQGYIIHERSRLPAHLAADITQLGVGALLHDLGKLSLPEELRSFRLSAQDRGDPIWQQHTEAGFEMARGGLDPTAAQVVLNHHQSYDGSGFPARKAQLGLGDELRPLLEDEIHIFCRITAIADRLENFRHLPDGATAPTVVALKRLANPGYYKWFDPIVYRAFRETVPPFTLGEQVTLSNGLPVVVVELNDQHPCRPTVRPIDLELAQKPDDPAAGDQSNLSHDDIHLASRSDLHIAQVGNFDVTPYLH